MLAEAARKLSEKGLDLIVANDVSRPDSGFEVDTNKVTLLVKNGTRVALPVMSKCRVARRIIRWIEAEAESRPGKRCGVSSGRRRQPPWAIHPVTAL